MVAKIIDGKQISKNKLEFIRKEIEKREQNNLRKPCLAVVLIGSNPASKIYVRNKKLACDYVGIKSLVYEENENFTEEQLINLILDLNSRKDVDGILVQLPLPKHINTQKIIELIKTDKDVDAFHPYNIGRLALRIPIMRPCTPKGVMTLLEESNIKIKTKNVTIVGASNIVGRPLALEMLLAGATVTVCHIFTSQDDLVNEIKKADIVVVAIGKPNVINSEWFNPNSVVVDVGINRLEDGSLCGDVDFESAKLVVSSITPVPGGVGPMTIAILMENTLLAATIHDKQ